MKMQNCSTEKTQLTSIVADAIKFLAPHFEVNLNEEGLEFPEVLIGKPEYRQGIIYLPPLRPEVRPTISYYFIGHEVGHWLHSVVNPDLYSEDKKDNLILDYLREAVARCSGTICIIGEGWLQNEKYTLVELARMNLEEAESKFDYIYYLKQKLAF